MKINLENEDQARLFAWGDLEGWEYIDCIIDHESLYKDYATAMTICKQESTGIHYALYWDSYRSHYGSGDHQYNSTELIEVELVEKVTVTQEWVEK